MAVKVTLGIVEMPAPRDFRDGYLRSQQDRARSGPNVFTERREVHWNAKKAGEAERFVMASSFEMTPKNF